MNRTPREVWTFLGHWVGDRITVDQVLPGNVPDPRVDTGQWPDGLWSASAGGATVEQAQAFVTREFETREDL